MIPNRSNLVGQKSVEKNKEKKFKCDILSNVKQCEKGQTLVENDKIQKIKYDILSNFQTLCPYQILGVE